MMAIVPAFAHRQKTKKHVVAAEVTAFIRPAAPDVAGGIDAPRHMVHQKKAYQASPDQTAEGTLPRMVQNASNEGRNKKGEEHPKGKHLVNPRQDPAFPKVWDVASQIWWVWN